MTNIDCGDYSLLSGDIDQSLQRYFMDHDHDFIFIICDRNTHRHCLPMIPEDIREKSRIIRIPVGESYKHLKTCSLIWEDMVKTGLSRKSLVLNLGGGVICDMGGFCASVFMRGIPFIHIPTSLLAMVDASIGGKLGVDFDGLKNYIGLFRNPRNVLMDARFLKTLSREEFKNGFAEIIKHALINDSKKWKWISTQTTIPDTLENHDIHNSVQIKINIVREDPMEKGIRKALNFGHTIGHAIETLRLNSGKPISHGHAVALGIVAESFISVKHDLLSAREFTEIKKYILRHFQALTFTDKDIENILLLTKQDKKNAHSATKMTLLNGIGSYSLNVEINDISVIESIEQIRAF